MIRQAVVCSLLLAALGGCSVAMTPRTADVPMPPAVVACQAEPAQFAVGQVATPALVQQAQERAGAARARVLRPGEMVTMEFDATRLNLEVDAANRVLRVRCG